MSTPTNDQDLENALLAYAPILRRAKWANIADLRHSLISTPDLSKIVGSQLKPLRRVRSAAFVDWTSLWHAAQLLQGRATVADPFVALADLNAVLAAVLFYDRLISVGGSQEAEAVATGLGVEGVIVSLDTRDDDIRALVDDVYTSSARALANAGRSSFNADREWLSLLASGWRALVPDITLPESRDVDRVLQWSHSSSPQRDSYRDMFHFTGSLWGKKPWDTQLVVDNDTRALFYEGLARSLEILLSGPDGRGPRLRYVGGVLRAPMQRALRTLEARFWAGLAPSIESQASDMADDRWEPETSLLLPFWTAAILESCEGITDLRKQVPKWRRRAQGLRKRRAELEDELAVENVKTRDELRRALVGSSSKLGRGTGAKAAGAVLGQIVETGLTCACPPAAFMTPGAKVITDKLVGQSASNVGLRLLKPHVWCFSKLVDAADGLTRPQRRLVELFKLPIADHREPSTFLERVGDVMWAL